LINGSKPRATWDCTAKGWTAKIGPDLPVFKGWIPTPESEKTTWKSNFCQHFSGSLHYHLVQNLKKSKMWINKPR